MLNANKKCCDGKMVCFCFGEIGSTDMTDKREDLHEKTETNFYSRNIEKYNCPIPRPRFILKTLKGKTF